MTELENLVLQAQGAGFITGIKEALRIIAAENTIAFVAGRAPSIGNIQRMLTEAAEKENSVPGTYTKEKTMTQITVQYIPDELLIEMNKIVEAHQNKPVKQRQCLVCGTWINAGDICCDETEYNPQDFNPVSDNEIDWEAGKDLF